MDLSSTLRFPHSPHSLRCGITPHSSTGSPPPAASPRGPLLSVFGSHPRLQTLATPRRSPRSQPPHLPARLPATTPALLRRSAGKRRLTEIALGPLPASDAPFPVLVLRRGDIASPCARQSPSWFSAVQMSDAKTAYSSEPQSPLDFHQTRDVECCRRRSTTALCHFGDSWQG